MYVVGKISSKEIERYGVVTMKSGQTTASVSQKASKCKVLTVSGHKLRGP
jgi:hypothetical protein